MSLWQFMACINGYADAHGANKGKLTTDEVEELGRLIDGD